MSLEQAVRLVRNPSQERSYYPSGNNGLLEDHSPAVDRRLRPFLYKNRYEFKKEHAWIWKALLHDRRQPMSVRLCAAYFLLDSYEAARRFVTTQVASKKLHYRINAASIVVHHVNHHKEKQWGIDLMIGLLNDGSIDYRLTRSSYDRTFYLDRYGIETSPIGSICYSLGSRKETRAVPAIIAAMERDPGMYYAAHALGQIGDPRAIPVLIQCLKDGSGSTESVITALGKLKSKEAVPILIKRLGSNGDSFSGFGFTDTKILLETLLNIGDTRAIAPIEEFLRREHSKHTKAIARRVLVQLKSDNPVDKLLEMFKKEMYEIEQGNILFDLTKYNDPQVIDKLDLIARSSGSAYLRREAICCLARIGDRRSLLVLASLLDITFSRDLIARHGWKGIPDFREYFPERIVQWLRYRTGQDFGRDRAAWEAWIKEHIKPSPTFAESNDLLNSP